jgi:ABC-type lipoprotein release transport system permease subunit
MRSMSGDCTASRRMTQRTVESSSSPNGVTMTFGLSALTLLATSLLACWLPARRAARLDPVQSLRVE